MSKKKRWICAFAAAIILVGLGYWRYRAINKRFAEFSDNQTVFYPRDTVLPFGEDYLDYNQQASGYTIAVTDYRILDYTDFCKESGFQSEGEKMLPDRVALVTVTLCNAAGGEPGVALSNILLHGVDFNLGLNWDMLEYLNPILEGYMGISLSQGETCTLVLPYGAFKERFNSRTWDRFDETPLYLKVTSYPTEKNIVIQ